MSYHSAVSGYEELEDRLRQLEFLIGQQMVAFAAIDAHLREVEGSRTVRGLPCADAVVLDGVFRRQRRSLGSRA